MNKTVTSNLLLGLKNSKKYSRNQYNYTAFWSYNFKQGLKNLEI